MGTAGIEPALRNLGLSTEQMNLHCIPHRNSRIRTCILRRPCVKRNRTLLVRHPRPSTLPVKLCSYFGHSVMFMHAQTIQPIYTSFLPIVIGRDMTINLTNINCSLGAMFNNHCTNRTCVASVVALTSNLDGVLDGRCRRIRMLTHSGHTKFCDSFVLVTFSVCLYLCNLSRN